MERFVLQKLTEWKNTPNRKPLILNGARQVGKTWLLHEFARREYKKEAYVVCRKNPVVSEIFARDFDIPRIIKALSAISKTDISEGDTLIILDEVQEVPLAIEALKYFCEDAPGYHIAVAGSLLGISMHAGVSFPVGKVNQIDVFPMSFSEFLLAIGEDEKYKLLCDGDFQTISLLHEKFIDLLQQYYYVGGMPEVVAKYAETGGFQDVRRIQKEILSGYEHDFSKHAPTDLVARIRLVWKSIASQLFKENRKFVFGALRKGARSADFELAISWLADAGLVIKVPCCTKPALPLAVYEELTAFKLYLLDIGLLGAMANIDAEQVIVDNQIFTEYKGGMTEQYVLQEMKSCGISPIFYHKTGDSRLEIDFLIQHNAKLLPIEVKAGGNVRANSLSKFLANNPEISAIRFSMLPYKQQQQMINLPLYAVPAMLIVRASSNR